MAQVITFEDYRPSPRYDSEPWTQVRIEEGTTSSGPWGLIDTLPLSPVDADPTNPAYRNFTTDLASETPDLWYRLIFIDAEGDIGLPTLPVQNSLDERPVYASTTELATLLRVSATQRHAALMRVLKSAALEIDSEIGTADILGNTLPYSSPPALVSEVNLERAVEHWRQMEAPWGLVGLGVEMGSTFISRDTWERHALKLAPLKGDWGLA